ncbi:hypothetical protein [Thiocapsa sp.]
MHMTKYTDYSRRVLVLPAVQDDRVLGIAEISKAFQISRNHLGSIYIPDS